MKTGNESQCDFFLNNALSCLGFFVFVFAVSMDTWYLLPLLGNWEALLCLSACWCYHSRRNAGSVPFKPCVKLTFHPLHSVTFRNDVCTWLPLCILGECGERDFPPAVSHIPVHIGGPVLGPPVKCLHLCVHIPQPVSLPAPAFNHRPPEAQKYHLLQFLLPGVSKRRWEFFHQLGSLQYFLAKVHFFEPFLLKKMEESFSAVAAEAFPQGKYHRKQAPQERNAHFVPFHQLDLVLLLLQPWFLFLFVMLFVVNVGVDADRNACMVRNFTQTTWWTCSWLLGGAGHPAGHLRLNSPEAASQRKLGQGSALLFLLQNHETNGASSRRYFTYLKDKVENTKFKKKISLDFMYNISTARGKNMLCFISFHFNQWKSHLLMN